MTSFMDFIIEQPLSFATIGFVIVALYLVVMAARLFDEQLRLQLTRAKERPRRNAIVVFNGPDHKGPMYFDPEQISAVVALTPDTCGIITIGNAYIRVEGTATGVMTKIWEARERNVA